MSTEYTAQQIEAAVAEQRDFFRSRATLDTAYRREMLRRLAEALDRWEQPLCDALAADLHKSREEAYMTELSIVRDEIRYHLRHLRGWARPQRRRTPLKMFPSRSRIVVEPLGVALIVSPWNYPVQLLLNPLVAAVSAGCTAVLKPSPHTPHVSETLAQMISRTFDRRYITVIEGGREVNTMLFEQRYDIIFFTGSPSLGRVVMQAAARHPHARGVGVGRQEPLHRGPRRRHTYRRAAHSMGQDAQCRTDMYRSRLSAHTPQRETTLRRRVRRSRQADARRRPAAESALCTHGRRCGIPARRVVPRPGACGGRRPKLRRRPVYRADAARRRSRRCRRHAGGDIRPSAADDRLRRYSRGRPIHRRQEAAAGSILLRTAGRRTRSRPPDIVGRRLHQRHDNAHRQPQTALRRRRQLRAWAPTTAARASRLSHRRAVVTTPTAFDLPFRYMPYRMFHWIKKIL